MQRTLSYFITFWTLCATVGLYHVNVRGHFQHTQPVHYGLDWCLRQDHTAPQSSRCYCSSVVDASPDRNCCAVQEFCHIRLYFHSLPLSCNNSHFVTQIIHCPFPFHGIAMGKMGNGNSHSQWKSLIWRKKFRQKTELGGDKWSVAYAPLGAASQVKKHLWLMLS